MNALLISELSNEQLDPINALALIEQHVFASHADIVQKIDQLIYQCQVDLAAEHDPEYDIVERIEYFLDNLYCQQLFADNKRERWSLLSFEPCKALDYKIIAPALKIILVQYITQACGFQADVVFIPQSFMVRIACDEDSSVIFDPVTGECVNGQEYAARTSDVQGDPSRHELRGENNKLLLFNYLTTLKNTFIYEQRFEQALKCVDILLALYPDDPLERRDRGFLLHQLDCFKVAYDDYRFFVEQCPEDPGAQLLKLQLDNIKITDNILH